MFSVTRLLDIDPAARDRVLGALRATAEECGAQRWIVEPTDTGSRNGGDILMHLRFDSQTRGNQTQLQLGQLLDEPAVTRINGATYAGEPILSGRPGSVYRALLLRVHADTPPETVSRFEAELASMAGYVDTIRAWQLSRVLDPVGTTAWTHVFEQEFSDVDGLMGPYLMHPIHWAVVDRWFDPESTDTIVRDRVSHSFCAMDRPVLHAHR